MFCMVSYGGSDGGCVDHCDGMAWFFYFLWNAESSLDCDFVCDVYVDPCDGDDNKSWSCAK